MTTAWHPLPVELEVRNLRSFTGKPALIRLDGGFTALLGVNNAGKSSLLRMFWELRPIFRQLVNAYSTPNGGWAATHLQGQPLGVPPQLAAGERIFPTGSNGDLTLAFHLPPSPYGPSDALWPRRATITLHRQDSAFSLSVETIEGAFNPDGAMVRRIRDGRGTGDDSSIWEETSAPQRRVDMQPLGEIARCLADAMYIGPFRNAINVGSGDYFDVKVGDAFIHQLNTLKSGPSPQANEAIARMTKELRRIFGFQELEINPTPDGTLQLNIDGFSYRGSEVGAGFTHFLLVAANVLTRRPTLLLIDEPELNLHPALQLDYLTFLGSYTTTGVMFATHSLGLARAAAERIYCVTKHDGVSELTPYEDTPNLAALTGQLGFGGNSDLQFEGVLLVEGVTEVKVFQQLLRLYRKEHRFVIVPLGGEALIKRDAALELGELRRLADRVVAVIDSERPAADAALDSKRAAFAMTCERLGIPCTVLERRATENYFPEHAVKAVYGSAGRALDRYERSKDVGLSWSKPNNWRIARTMTRADLDDSDLGKALEAL